jgi:2-enoate reductase
VKIELGKEATSELIEEENPDVIILATGARPYIPDIPGIESQKVCTAWDILNGKTEAGHKVIVIGGGNVGLETAEYLAEKGKKVTVLEKLSEVGVDVEPTNRKLLLERLKDHGVDILTKVSVTDITDHGVVFLVGQDKKTLNAGTVILAQGAASNKQLEDLNNRESWETYSIGDCTAPRNILAAIHDGAWVARQI